MSTSTKLLEKYQLIMKEPMGEELGETVHLLSCTDWVRIMVVRSSEKVGVCSIEVEISLPSCIIDPVSKDSADVTDKQSPALNFIRNAIVHLQYLVKLGSAGFLLGIFSAEGFWSASIELMDCPNLDFFRVLTPPE